jgi:PKHD-type hydroxylase
MSEDRATEEKRTAPLYFLHWVQAEEPLSPETCDRIVELGQSFPAEVGKIEDGKVRQERQSMLHRMRPESRTRDFFQQLFRLMGEINEAYFGLALEGIVSPDYIEYEAGFGRFDWHNDYAYMAPDRVRKLTLILQLSEPEDYEGGQLEVFTSEVVALPKQRGAILAFPSFLYHRVTPVTRGRRRSLVVWASGPPFR